MTGIKRATRSVLYAFILASVAAHAETLVVGFEDLDIYPYGRPHDEQVYEGYFRDVMEAFAAARGYELKLLVLPAKRLHAGFRKGEADLYVPDNPSWSAEFKQDLDIAYSDVVAVALDGLLVLPGKENEKLGEGIVRIGTVLGVTLVPFLKELEAGVVTADYSADHQAVYRKLLMGRVDAVYSNLAIARYILSRIQEDAGAVAWSEAVPLVRSEFHASSATRPELVAAFNQWLRSHQAEVETIKKRFELVESEPAAPR